MALSYITRVADGVQAQFDFPFGYLSRSHVFVFVDRTLVAFKWISDFLVEPLVPLLPGQQITIRRLTDRANRVTTYTDGQTLLASSLNAGDLQTFFIAQEMIDQIEEGIVSGDVSVLNPGAGYITAQWIQDQLTANLAAAPQFGAINEALLGEALARAQGLAAEAAARANAIGAEAIARGAAIAAEAAARTNAVLTVATDLQAEAATRTADVLALTAADAATVGRLNIVESDLNTPTTGVKAKLVTVENSVTTETTARASADTAILAEINTPGTGLKARATSLEIRTTAVETGKAEASALTALAARVTTAEADINTAEAAITSEAATRATADTAISSSVTALTARVGTAEADINAAEAAIVTANNAIATETAARASADTAILAEINDPTTGLKARATSLEGRTTSVELNKAEATALNALAARVSTAEGDINAAEASVVTEATARVSADNALSSSITSLTSRVGIAEADIVSVENAIATETGARTTAVNSINARLGPVEAGLVTVNSAVADLEASKAEVSSVTSLTAEVNTVKNSRGGIGPLPDPNMYDSAFWALIPGATSFAEGNPFPSGVRSIRIGDGSGLRDVYTQHFKVEPGATYKITFSYWNGFPSFSGFVRPMVHVPLTAWLNPVNNTGVSDTGPAGQAGDITAGGSASSHTISYTVPASVGYLQFRTRSDFTGADFYYRWIIEKITAAEDTAARASITNEAAARAAADSANATSINAVTAQLDNGRYVKNDFPDPEFALGFPSALLEGGWDGNSGIQVVRQLLPGGWAGKGDGLNTLYSMVNGTPAAGTVWQDVTTKTRARLKVSPGVRLYGRALAGGHRLASYQLIMDFYDANGGFITTIVGAVVTNPPTAIAWEGNPANFTELKVWITAPAGAAFCQLAVRAIASGENLPYLWTTGHQLCKLLPRSADVTVPYSAALAQITTLREALATGSSSTARLMLSVNTANNVANIEAVAQEGEGVWNGSKITLNADLIGLLAKAINFGTNTVFEDAKGSIYTTTSGKRIRLLGPFGASNDLLLWYGASSIALEAETKTNGDFSIATDGKTYYKAAELGVGSAQSRTKSASGAANVTTNNVWETICIVGYGDIPNPSQFGDFAVGLVGSSQSGGVAAGTGWEWRIVHAPAANFTDAVVLKSGTLTISRGGQTEPGVYEPPTINSFSGFTSTAVPASRFGAVNVILQVKRTSGSATIGLTGSITVNSILP